MEEDEQIKKQFNLYLADQDHRKKFRNMVRVAWDTMRLDISVRRLE